MGAGQCVEGAAGSYPLFWPVIRRHSQRWHRENHPDCERLLPNAARAVETFLDAPADEDR